MLTIRQVNGTTASAAFLAHVPPGASVTIATADGNADIAWGPSSAVTFTTGAIVPPGGAVSFDNPSFASPFDIWVISNTGGHEVSATIITNQ